MAQNKVFLDPDNITEWLASTGYLFPRNEQELNRYDKLFSDHKDLILSDSSVSVERILSGNIRSLPAVVHFIAQDASQIINQYRMVARNGLEGLPDHVVNKMMNNQEKNGSSKKEEDQ
jgi:hypothetical protein